MSKWSAQHFHKPNKACLSKVRRTCTCRFSPDTLPKVSDMKESCPKFKGQVQSSLFARTVCRETRAQIPTNLRARCIIYCSVHPTQTNVITHIVAASFRPRAVWWYSNLAQKSLYLQFCCCSDAGLHMQGASNILPFIHAFPRKPAATASNVATMPPLS